MNWFKQAIDSTTSFAKTLLIDESEWEQEAVGINSTLVEYVQNITQHPATFLKFPVENIDQG
jgi:hypothetical protein